MHSISVLSLNLWNLSGPLPDRMREVRRWLTVLDPDVVGFQEVVYSEGDEATHHGIWAGLPYDVAFHGTVDFGDKGRFGNAVLSKFPIRSVEHHDLPGLDQEEGRIVVHALTELPSGRTFDVYCTHLNWRFDQGYVREAQVREIDAFVRRTAQPPSASQPPVLLGDFNAEPDSTEIRYLAGLTSLGGRSTVYQDAWRVAGGRGGGLTWDMRNPFAASGWEWSRRIDYVWSGYPDVVTGRGRVLSARLACDFTMTGTYASDHFGVYAEILA